MGRKARPALRGLGVLGARLKQIRQRSGLSQMKLARLIGFDPAHGYKYILRLEKGQVPNPTLRTIAACLEACGAAWQDVADVLPGTGGVDTPISVPLSSSHRTVPGSMAPGPRPSPPLPRHKDPRPMREQLRARRIEQHELHSRRFWSAVRQADAAAAELLRSLRVSPAQRRAYLSFARACCSTIDAFEAARPEVAGRELAKLIQPAVAQGLDRGILSPIQTACIQVFGPGAPAGRKGPAV
jgi:transcriptional regulator with XRE-family HTH domain